MDSAPWKRATSHIDACAWVFGQKRNRKYASTTVYNGLGRCWLFLFPKLKTPMKKGKRFVTIKEIKEESKEELLATTKSAFSKCFEDWKKRWLKCAISERGYFEVSKIVFCDFVSADFWQKLWTFVIERREMCRVVI